MSAIIKRKILKRERMDLQFNRNDHYTSAVSFSQIMSNKIPHSSIFNKWEISTVMSDAFIIVSIEFPSDTLFIQTNIENDLIKNMKVNFLVSHEIAETIFVVGDIFIESEKYWKIESIIRAPETTRPKFFIRATDN